MTGLYLAALLAAIGCELLLDHRFRLFWWRDARSAGVTTAVAVAFFIVWDLLGISFGFFRVGDQDLMLGAYLAPHLPVEEPVFLVLLVQSAMTAYGLAARWLRR